MPFVSWRPYRTNAYQKNEDVVFKVVKELKDTKRGSGGIGSTGK